MPGIYSVLSLLNILNLKIPSHNTYFYILFIKKGLPEIFAVHESPPDGFVAWENAVSYVIKQRRLQKEGSAQNSNQKLNQTSSAHFFGR